MMMMMTTTMMMTHIVRDSKQVIYFFQALRSMTSPLSDGHLSLWRRPIGHSIGQIVLFKPMYKQGKIFIPAFQSSQRKNFHRRHTRDPLELAAPPSGIPIGEYIYIYKYISSRVYVRLDTFVKNATSFFTFLRLFQKTTSEKRRCIIAN